MIYTPLTRRTRFFLVILAFIICLVLTVLLEKHAIAATSLAQETMGTWQIIPMPSQSDRMQAVHTALLPNGKVLMVNGSSFRSTLVQENGEFKFIEGVDLKNYDVINNSGLLNPETGEFERIPSPPALRYDTDLNHETTNDLFCSGHVQLVDGNVLFVGGTGRYYPGGAFTGSKWLNLYNWQTGKWEDLGQMQDGRWYPTLVPLANGKIVIFSGLRFEEPNQINPAIEIFDPKTKKLHYIDLRDVRNSPFNTEVPGEDVYDSIDLYPRIFPLSDGRLLITGDEAGIEGVLVPHLSKKSYLMSIQETSSGEISVSFEVGPDRLETSKAYGTAIQIPNSEDILLLGGIVGTNSINFGRGGNVDTNKYPGASIATSVQHWISPQNSGTKNGKWEVFPTFLDQPRANLQAVILPTKEILVTNGGRYPEYDPIYQPLLLTPDKAAQGGYKTQSLSSAKFPRLYHNGAILLPDARVLIVGGNATRAAREKDGTLHVDIVGDPTTFFKLASNASMLKNKSNGVEQFDINTYYDDPNHYFLGADPKPFVPSEIWQGEVFSPPYLFKPGTRPEILGAPQIIKYSQVGAILVKDATPNGSLVLNKLGTVTHSFDYGQRLVELPIRTSDVKARTSDGKAVDGEVVIFTAPTNANLYPPGYYMMFYLNNLGKPSHAKIIKLEAAANT